MDQVERRASSRRDIKSPVSLTIEATSLKGETVNIGEGGALVHAEGRIAVLFHFEGKEHRGRLVWTVPLEGEMAAYAIALDQALGRRSDVSLDGPAVQTTPDADHSSGEPGKVSFETKVWVDRAATSVDGRFVVLSAGEAFLELGEPHPLGTMMRVRFTLAPIGEIDCRAIVRKSLGTQGVGVEFLNLDPHDQECIRMFVEQQG